MNNKHDSNQNYEINDLLEMFDLELISENDSQNKDNEIIKSDETQSSVMNDNNLEMSKKNGSSAILKLIIASILVIITVFTTLFLTEQFYQAKYTEKQVAELDQKVTEKIQNNTVNTKSTNNTSSPKNCEDYKERI